jgi:hypothetical protein
MLATRQSLTFIATIFFATIGIVQADNKHDWLENVPTEQFRLPIFGQNGFRVWELEGQEGIARSSSMIEVKGMKLRTYADNGTDITMLLESPLAFFQPKDHVANGPGFIHATGAKFNLVGRNWHWQGKPNGNNTLEIKEEVRVTFTKAFKY